MSDKTHSQTEVKGAVVKQIVKSTLDLMSPAQAQALQATMKIPSPIFDGTWYDATILSNFLRDAKLHVKVDESFLLTVGRESTKALLNGVHRFLIRNVPAHLIVKHTSLYFGNFYRGGTMAVKMLEAGHAQITYAHFDSMSRDLWLSVGGGIAVVLEAARAKDVKIQLVSTIADKDFLFDYRWHE